MSDEAYSEERYQSMKKLLKERVGAKRYRHSKGVSKTAGQMAKTYGCDVAQARMAGLLHDWDKGLGIDEIRERAADLAVDIDPVVVSDMPWLLHGPTAAVALKNEYPDLGDEVFQAIARHTSGAAEMEPLDSIIYVADIIEPHRVYDDASGLQALRDAVGTVPLEQLYFLAFKYSFLHLIDHDRQLYPETARIWNALMFKYGKAKDWK